jgi:hypothetical protein
MVQQIRLKFGESSHFKARFAIPTENFENMVLSMGLFTYVQFSQKKFLVKYLMYFLMRSQ